MYRAAASISNSATPPPIPERTRTHVFALHDERCAELSKKIYEKITDKITRDKTGFEEFTHPPGRKAKAARLRAFGYVEDETAFLCFRGTDRLRNWVTNLYLGPTGLPKRHAGFEGAWRLLQPQVTTWLDTWLETVPSRRLFITGHSLGGAMAQMAAWELAERWPIEAVVCFGTPLIGWQAFAQAYDKKPICGRTQISLGDVTRTFVFKSDLVRTFVLPRLGCRRVGVEIPIDETGRQNNSFAPWDIDAVDTTAKIFFAIVGDDPHALSTPVLQTGSISRLPTAPSLTHSSLFSGYRSYVARTLMNVPQIGAVVLAVNAMMVLFLSALFFRRDIGYHNPGKRYAIALKERVARLLPQAYLEWGDTLLASGDISGALPYLLHAVRSAEADARGEGITSPRLEQYTWRPRLSLAAAYAAQQDYPAAIACLNALIDAYPPASKPFAFLPSSKVVVDADGAITVSPEIAAIQCRAEVYRLAGYFKEAMADCTTLIELASGWNETAFTVLRKRAQRQFGAHRLLAAGVNFRGAQVAAETERLMDQRTAAFQRNISPTWAWAHLRKAAAANGLKAYELVIDEASAALALGVEGGSAYASRHRSRVPGQLRCGACGPHAGDQSQTDECPLPLPTGSHLLDGTFDHCGFHGRPGQHLSGPVVHLGRPRPGATGPAQDLGTGALARKRPSLVGSP